MSNVFNNQIFGGSQNIAQGSQDFSQEVQVGSIATGDTSALLQALLDSGAISKSDVDDLRVAIEADNPEGAAAGTSPVAGPQVQGWASRLGIAAGGVTGKVGISAAGGVVASLIRQFFGIA